MMLFFAVMSSQTFQSKIHNTSKILTSVKLMYFYGRNSIFLPHMIYVIFITP